MGKWYKKKQWRTKKVPKSKFKTEKEKMKMKIMIGTKRMMILISHLEEDVYLYSFFMTCILVQLNTLQTIQSKNEDNMTINSNNMDILIKSNHDPDNGIQIGAYNRPSFNNTNN